jgi:alpha 1,3-mannosyltransferase
MNRFSRHLFPWTARHSPDHMLLHTSSTTGGRGIVITVGERQTAYVLTSIKTFREFGCDLPVEVFFLGDSDLHEDSRAALAELPGVITRDLSKMVYDDGWTLKGIVEQGYVLQDLIRELNVVLSGWAAKPMAMLLSSFREVILIDADVFFFVDPTTLLSDREYLRLGALFFRDRLFAPTDHADFISKSLPWPLSQNILQSNRWWSGTSHHMQESGVVVVDKWRHFVALLLATRLNGPDRDGNDALGKKGVYQMMHGDKETFWLSWEMAGDTDYAFYDGRAGQIGVLTPSDVEVGHEGEMEMCGKQLLHTSRDGRPLWFNGWIATDKHKENHLTSFQDFQGFVTEPRETSRWAPPYWDGWKVREGNIMCLPGDGYALLSPGERRKVELILGTAEKVVASGV